ncbi:response regulator [Leadbettera azotonutricia]|uniref:Two component transcriptional regulator, AraC family n=1 Tax=Leadbettera azotonutricia (strain ATCC BAA-888 / DSM 13862 / ZAS-9) TaxID=545695 RepID=F5YF39_LEAAZ|nr:response regulator [Leadbettera azotonutricia]AEF80638.1 two component transcriptional regulator, AraC family [Leadbettera azotonutricia ZAS-9]
MYKVVLAEDEPAAAEHIQDIIKLYCPQFELVIGDNGKAGLDLARQHRPDLLLTDIRMPQMDGLELIRALHEELPDIKTMILSGYQDFEYARTALQCGAIEYLLKPISPSTLQTALERAIPLIKKTIEEKRFALLKMLLNQEAPDPAQLRRYFPASAYSAGICRKNGLPSRFFKNLNQPLLFQNQRVQSDEDEKTGETLLALKGRDEMESIYLAPGNALLNGSRTVEFMDTENSLPGYTTAVLWSQVFQIEEFPRIIAALYTTLDTRLVIGKSQSISAGGNNQVTRPKNPSPNTEMDQALKHYLKEHKTGLIQKLLNDWLDEWEKEGQGQLFVEESVRLFIERVNHAENSPGENLELLIANAFSQAACYGDLKESLALILEKLLPSQEERIDKIDTPEFFNLIKQYVDAHSAEDLSLESTCRHFGISQTYLSRLFRKYTDLSFLNYLTIARVEKAKTYLLNEGTLIRDAAVMAGFNDPLYFSRVFRSITGFTPSEYAQGPHKNSPC